MNFTMTMHTVQLYICLSTAVCNSPGRGNLTRLRLFDNGTRERVRSQRSVPQTTQTTKLLVASLMGQEAQVRELHEMEAQLHQLYHSTATVASRQHAVQALAMVLDTLGELGGAPSCTHTKLQRRLTETIEASRALRGMVETNKEAMRALDSAIVAKQQLVNAKGGPADSRMASGLAAECAELNVLLGRTNPKLESALRAFRAAAAREAKAAEYFEVSGKRRVQKVKKVTVVGVKTADTAKERAKAALPPTPYPREPPEAPPPPSLPAAGRLPDASNTKLDLHGIKQSALLREIRERGKVESGHASLPQEDPPPPSPVRAQSPEPKLRSSSPNSPNRHPSKKKYVPPTLQSTTRAIAAVHAFGGITAGKMLKPTKLQMEAVTEPEPEPEQNDDALRKSMLDGHSVGEAVHAVQEGSELTMYFATGKKKHSRFFWVNRSSSHGALQLCWAKKKGAGKHKAEMLHAILPEPDIASAVDLFREVRE